MEQHDSPEYEKMKKLASYTGPCKVCGKKLSLFKRGDLIWIAHNAHGCTSVLVNAVELYDENDVSWWNNNMV